MRTTIVLEPGVSMYLPTGTPHAARAQDTVSLHVTLGVNQVTWRQVLDRALRHLLEEAGEEHLPAGYLQDPAVLRDGLSERLERLAARLREVDPAAVADREVERFLTSRNPSQRGGLRDRIAARGLDDDTLLARRRGRPCELVADGERLRVLLGDRELRVPGRLAPALEGIRTRETLRPRDLADLLDAESRVVLCRRLVREGLLEVIA
jgi:ribosomal protein L16 Arg81 hydroxylase